MLKFTKDRIRLSVLLGCIASVMQAQAAPGVLSNKPMFLGTEIQPNILWLVDDSGSMDWEVLQSSGARAAYGGLPNSGDLDITPTRNDQDEMLESCAGYNVMYFDPSRTYVPWTGVDTNGNAYQDQSITSALRNPYNPGAGSIDLTDDEGFGDPPGYFVWNDADGDGVFDIGECPDPNRGGYDYNGTFRATAAGFGPAVMSATDLANFANWYSYYRKREYVAKAALSQIINDSQARMGLATLHNNSSVGTQVEDVDDISIPLDANAQANKRQLMEHLFEINSSGGTPLRQTLARAGEYFKVGANPGTSLFGFAPSPNSPILDSNNGGQCQQNFSILMSDGTWNGSNPSVGNADADGATSPYDGGSYADNQSNTLADVAMKYYEEDLATGLTNSVPVIVGTDENSAQHMVTYTVAFGVNGTLSSNPPNTTDAFAWPTVNSGQTTTIDDMRHAAWNGRGAFLNAGNPDDLISSLRAAIENIGDRDGAASAVAFNSTSLETDTLVFQARFDSGGWHGTLVAFEFDENGVGNLEWSAGTVLDDRDLVNRPRNIITFNGVEGIPFEFPADYTSPTADELSVVQIADVLADSDFDVSTIDPAQITSNQAFGEAMVSFLRGGDENEVDQGATYSFRNRFDRRLGDIIHSSPSFVGKPGAAYPNRIEGIGNEYSDYIIAQENRRPMVYAGANDGMLHAFRAVDGFETFAYIPQFLFDDRNSRGLHFLADEAYSHIPYVDGSPLVADVFVESSWKTYLVGGVRAGGKGIYVLDITNPSAINEGNADKLVKQEFTHDDLGFTFSRPLVGKMNNGRWAAIFGNGYNSDPTGDGRAKLFVLYLDGPGGFELIDTEVGSVTAADCQNASSDCNGLSSPTVLDLDSNGTIDRVYAGDVQGNVWAFDLSNTVSSAWKVAYKDASDSPTPLFTACSATPCSQSTRQAITSLSVANVHPDRLALSTEPNLMVYVGTGQWVSENDNLNTSTQTMYGIWDAAVPALTRDNLQQQTISNSVSVIGGRDLSSNNVNYVVNSELGWYIDLPDLGERIVVEPVVIDNLILFNTTVPDSASCNGGGYGYLMFADRMTGGAPGFVVLDLNNDGIFDDTPVSGTRMSSIPGGGRLIDGKYVISDSGGNITDYGVQTGKSTPSSRDSWSVIK